MADNTNPSHSSERREPGSTLGTEHSALSTQHSALGARYARQELFFGLGRQGQERLARARVAVVGCGALGTVIANLLARAGVGFLRLVDRDYVELTNLQRQVLFDEADVARGAPKAVAAVEKLARVNSQIALEAAVEDLNADTVERLIGDVDLVMDGTDNFETRYLLNEACVQRGLPWIYSAAIASYGVTLTILPHQTPCLRCIFTESPPPGTVPTCDTAGVLNPIPG
ncbi:MAG: ThiF family adenylyltransferase, partial [Chloroflexi bacterium]|nr:ThiF family adenylyltransferase [Chloroflexota bacterium]